MCCSHDLFKSTMTNVMYIIQCARSSSALASMTAAQQSVPQSVRTVQVMSPYKVIQKCSITDTIHGCCTVAVLGLFGLPGSWHVIDSAADVRFGRAQPHHDS